MTNYKKHINLIKNSLLFSLFLVVLIVTGCGEKKSLPPKAIASVDGKVLTDVSLNKIKTAHNYKNAEKKKIVNNWIEDKIFYLEAKENGLLSADNYIVLSDENNSELAKALLLKKFFDNFFYVPTEDELREYYNKHSGEFILTEDVYDIDVVSSEDFNQLLKLRSAAISKGWSAVENANGNKINIKRNSITSASKLAPEDFRNAVQMMETGKISPIVKGEENLFNLFRINKIFKKGEVSPFFAVKATIAQRLTLQKEVTEYEKYKEELYSKHKIEIYGDLNE
jgi:hypothetical protein